MRDIVVIGHPEIVESGLGCPVEHLRWPRIAVGVERVAMEIAAEPPWPGLGQRIGVNAATTEAGGLPRRTQTRVEPDLDLPIAAARSDLVRAEQDLPLSRADLPRAVRRRRPTFVDREFHLVAAAPAAETGAAFGDPAFVEESDVERVAAPDQRIRVDLIAVRIADVKLTQAGRYLERNVRVTALVILLEAARQGQRRAREVGRRQFRAAPVVASKTRTPSGAARRYTRVPGSGRTSGAVRTFRSASPSFTFTITSLPSGSETRTSAA